MIPERLKHADILIPAWFFVINSSPKIKLWSGLGRLNFLGQEFIGNSSLGLVEPLTSAVSLQPSFAKVLLSALDAQINELVFTAASKQSSGWLGLGFFDENLRPLTETFCKCFSGRVEQAEVKQSRDEYQLIVTFSDLLYAMQRNFPASYYEQAEQQEIDPKDASLASVQEVAKEMLLWGTHE